MATLQELIEALTEALDNNPPDTPVVLSADDFAGKGDFLALDFLLGEMGGPTLFCHQCGSEFGIDESGVANHLDPSSPTGIDHDADEDHVPYELEVEDVDPVERAWHERTSHG